jgi:hypothetical protein
MVLLFSFLSFSFSFVKVLKLTMHVLKLVIFFACIPTPKMFHLVLEESENIWLILRRLMQAIAALRYGIRTS